MRPFGIYIHIPFCAQRCPYCDFNTYVAPRLPERRYVDALCRELGHRLSLPAWRDRPVRSIYFGGGTPSLFRPESLERIISTIRRRAPVDPGAELTMEANPGSGVNAAFDALAEAGISRLSIGAQSFSPRHLKTLGRIHTVEETVETLARARAAGFSNINLDLIYALPDQTLDELESDLRTMRELEPAHVSAYTLTIEKGTPFYSTFERGELELPEDELAVEMMRTVRDRLAEQGLPQYEISNFAPPERRSIHNSAYWEGRDYLGVGAGAHSFSALEGGECGRRWSNYALPKKYIDEVSRTGAAEGWHDVLERRSAAFEFFFLGLRRTAGVECAEFLRRFGQSVDEVFGTQLRELQGDDLISSDTETVRLTLRGQELMDTVLEYFTEPELSSAGPIDADRIGGAHAR